MGFATSIVSRLKVDKAEKTHLDVTVVVWRHWLDLVLILAEISFGHQVMKPLVWGKISMGTRVYLPGTEKFLQGDVKWQGWKREEQCGQGETGLGPPWPGVSVGHSMRGRAYMGLCGQDSLGRAL